jgi:hypothetical protein
MTTLLAIAHALADQVDSVDLSGLDPPPVLSVWPFMLFNPTPPAVDIFPADPSAADAGFGPQSSMQFWTIRARVAPVDEEGNQTILLALREPAGETSIRAALLDDKTLGGLVEGIDVDWPTGYQPYRTSIIGDASHSATLLGCEWRVRMFVQSGSES